MTPEQLLEEILLLSETERAQLFELMRQRPALRQQWEGATRPVAHEETPSVVDSTADYLIIWDGGSRGNPGQGYGSYQLTAVKSGKSRVEKLEFPGRLTNNEAEYETLISALDTLATKIRERNRAPQDYTLELRGDSLLVVNQVLGKWKTKDARMAAYRKRTVDLLKQYGGYTIRHHDRSHSVAALGH